MKYLLFALVVIVTVSCTKQNNSITTPPTSPATGINVMVNYPGYVIVEKPQLQLGYLTWKVQDKDSNWISVQLDIIPDSIKAPYTFSRYSQYNVGIVKVGTAHPKSIMQYATASPDNSTRTSLELTEFTSSRVAGIFTGGIYGRFEMNYIKVK